MGGIDLAATMDALAAKMGTITGLRSFGWPNAAGPPPFAAVRYPDQIDYDLTFHRGADQATFECVLVLGKPDERTTRDELTKYVSSAGALEVKAAIEADPTLGGVIQTCRVTDCKIRELTMAAGIYQGAIFTVSVTA